MTNAAGSRRSIRRARRRKRSSYHHGNLRPALLAAATSLLGRRGPRALSLRETARKAGVSRAAPYRHFPSKEALLAAVSEEGFAKLARTGAQAGACAGGDPLRRIRAMAVAYLRFGLEHPQLFRLMFGSEVRSRDGYPSLREEASRGFALIVQTVSDAQAAGTLRPGNPHHLAMPVWVLMHGLTMLAVDEQIPAEVRSQVDLEPLAEWLLETLFNGLAPTAQA